MSIAQSMGARLMAHKDDLEERVNGHILNEPRFTCGRAAPGADFAARVGAP
jgi:hypothetical protein